MAESSQSKINLLGAVAGLILLALLVKEPLQDAYEERLPVAPNQQSSNHQQRSKNRVQPRKSFSFFSRKKPQAKLSLPFHPDSKPPMAKWHYRPSRYAYRNGAVRMLGKMAPELRIARWTKGVQPPKSIRENRGKILVIYAFQSW